MICRLFLTRSALNSPDLHTLCKILLYKRVYQKNRAYCRNDTGILYIQLIHGAVADHLLAAGLAIDTDCHVLTAEKKAIPGLYAAGDVCGSIEEKDAKQYGMGFDAALCYGYIMAETLKKEI